MTLDAVTFGLALAGFFLLATDAVMRSENRRDRRITWCLSLVVMAHVVCIWAFRFAWSWETAIAKGWGGFVLFHSAFLLIAVSPLLEARRANGVIWLAFGIVTLGGTAAAFTYPEVYVFQVPILMIAGVAWVKLARAWKAG